MVLRKVLFIWSNMPIFSFIGYAPWRSYLENLTIGNKFINRRVQLCIHCYVSRRKNYQYVITRLQNISLIVLKKKKYRRSHQRCRGSHQRCSARKGVLKNFANFTGKQLCWSIVLWNCKSPACKSFENRLQYNAVLWSFRNF